MKTTRPKLQLPDLSAAAHNVRRMRQPAVFVAPASLNETTRLKAHIRQLEAELAHAQAQAAQRAQREDRLNAITLRVVDNRAAYAAKTGLRRRPQVIITTAHVDIAD